MIVYVIVGACKGCVESVAVRACKSEAKKTRVSYDGFYDINRDAEGMADGESENDVSVYECEVDGNDGDVVL